MSAGCGPKKASGSGAISSWTRNSFQPTAGKALVWYQIYGHFPETVEISQTRYRCSGVPAGITVEHYWRRDHEDVVSGFLKQPFFATALKRELPGLANGVETAPECTVIRGEVADSVSLDYLRDVVGLVTWFLDNGGLAALDPQTFRWYGRDSWRSELFEPNGPVPRHHVVIFHSEEEGAAQKDRFWLHTRGMRKFARPDLSVHNVPAQYREAAIDLLNRLIEAQGFGQVVPEGQAINMQSLPPGIVCHHAGDLDDVEFNNKHIELRWPQ